jgi:hypothetical protein
MEWWSEKIRDLKLKEREKEKVRQVSICVSGFMQSGCFFWR